MRLLCDENIVGLESLAEFYELKTAPGRSLGPGDLAGVDALWVRSVTRVDAALVEGSSLRFVGTATAGIEHIDTQALGQRGIAFSAAPGANANAVVEYVLTALAALGEPWKRLDAGGSFGIVGYGNVGRRLARVSRGLGWDVRVCDPWVQRSGVPDDAPPFLDLDELLRCEVISLHTSLHRDEPWPSRHLIGARELAQLDASQWLLNAARGAVIDNAALYDRLHEPRAPQLVLDVWEGEPAFDTRLLQCPQLHLGTAHIAGYSWDSKWQATQMLLEAMAREGLPTPASRPAAPVAEPLSAVPGQGSLEIARGLLGQRYRIADDDAALRELAKVGDAVERAAGFDRLRRDYPQRRELRGSRINGAVSRNSRWIYEVLGVL